MNTADGSIAKFWIASLFVRPHIQANANGLARLSGSRPPHLLSRVDRCGGDAADRACSSVGLLRAAVPGSPLLMLQYSFSLHIVVSDGELKAGGSHPHRMFGSPVASACCEVHMLHVRWSRRAVPCQELALLCVSVSFKIGVSSPRGGRSVVRHSTRLWTRSVPVVDRQFDLRNAV